MWIKKLLKRSDAITGMFRGMLSDINQLNRKLIEPYRQRAKIGRYLKGHKVKKLHIGAGTDQLTDWFPTDISPNGDDIMYLDATIKFPIEDNTFDYIFSEHMVEHVPWPSGQFILSECRRVLKSGGRIRIATPDLSVLLSLHEKPLTPQGEQYIQWITDRCLEDIKEYKPIFVINNAFRSWGHQFLYDGELLEIAMQRAGFVNITRYAVGESEDEHLKDIECHGKTTSEEINRFETMVFEGTCP